MLSLFYRLSIIESQLGICISDVEPEEVTENWSSSSSVFGSTDEAQEVPVSISNSAGGGGMPVEEVNEIRGRLMTPLLVEFVLDGVLDRDQQSCLKTGVMWFSG